MAEHLKPSDVALLKIVKTNDSKGHLVSEHAAIAANQLSQLREQRNILLVYGGLAAAGSWILAYLILLR